MGDRIKYTALEALESLRECFSNDSPEYAISVRDKEYKLSGHLVIWNLPTTPDPHLGSIAKGGTRISSNLSLEGVTRLAKTMALKNATADLPLGGAKSGICAEADAPDFEQTYRAFVRKLKPMLAEHGGPFGGFGFDIGARPQHALWACDELNSTKSFTGKPSSLGGTDYDKEGIAGLGVAVAAKCAIENNGWDVSEITFAVQGIGAMGAGVIRYFSEFGGQLRYFSDLRLGGTFELKNGASLELLSAISDMQFDKIAKLIKKEAGAPLPVDFVLGSDVDVLFPCAIHDVIRGDNVDQIRAKYIVEGANNPSTAKAKVLYAANGGVLIPGVLANPGGIIAAYVELLSGAGVNPPSGVSLVQYAKDTVIEKISTNIESVLKLASHLEWSPSISAELLALSRLYPNDETSNFVRQLTK